MECLVSGGQPKAAPTSVHSISNSVDSKILVGADVIRPREMIKISRCARNDRGSRNDKMMVEMTDAFVISKERSTQRFSGCGVAEKSFRYRSRFLPSVEMTGSLVKISHFVRNDREFG